MSEPGVIAVCGKGGAGKTTVSAGLVRILMERSGRKVLAIDADPASGLAASLGMRAETTVNDIREELIARLKAGEKGDRRDVVNLLDYRVLGALVETRGLAFLAIGRPEEEGCYCQVNDLLRDVIGAIARGFDFVVIDGEAGIEQVNRRVMETVTHLLLVSDASARGLNVARSIAGVAARAMHCEKAGLVVNRLSGEDELARIVIPEGIPLLGWLPEDPALRGHDIRGDSILDVPECPALAALARCADALGL